nr:MAG TPA: hypothetical protein [Bacteriophage sp.]
MVLVNPADLAAFVKLLNIYIKSPFIEYYITLL